MTTNWIYFSETRHKDFGEHKGEDYILLYSGSKEKHEYGVGHNEYRVKKTGRESVDEQWRLVRKVLTTSCEKLLGYKNLRKREWISANTWKKI